MQCLVKRRADKTPLDRAASEQRENKCEIGMPREVTRNQRARPTQERYPKPDKAGIPAGRGIIRHRRKRNNQRVGTDQADSEWATLYEEEQLHHLTRHKISDREPEEA
jgi:hypothetical protein